MLKKRGYCMSEKDLPKTYTAEEVAKVLNYKSVETIRRLIKNKKISAVRIGGRYVITEETLQRLLKGEIDAGEDQ